MVSGVIPNNLRIIVPDISYVGVLGRYPLRHPVCGILQTLVFPKRLDLLLTLLDILIIYLHCYNISDRIWGIGGVNPSNISLYAGNTNPLNCIPLIWTKERQNHNWKSTGKISTMMTEDVKRQLSHSKVMSTICPPSEISGGRHRQDQAIGRLGDWEIEILVI